MGTTQLIRGTPYKIKSRSVRGRTSEGQNNPLLQRSPTVFIARVAPFMDQAALRYL